MRKIKRGAQLFGWEVRRCTVSGHGSTYLNLKRSDGAAISIRVSDHMNKTWKQRTANAYDCRTQPHDLLVLLRTLRHHPSPEPEPEPLSAEEEIQLANDMVTELNRRKHNAMK